MEMDGKEKALRAFIAAIEVTGGVITDDSGFFVPVADDEWIDLGEAYAQACVALGIPVKTPAPFHASVVKSV